LPNCIGLPPGVPLELRNEDLHRACLPDTLGQKTPTTY
jgi:hypothetical protein